MCSARNDSSAVRVVRRSAPLLSARNKRNRGNSSNGVDAITNLCGVVSIIVAGAILMFLRTLQPLTRPRMTRSLRLAQVLKGLLSVGSDGPSRGHLVQSRPLQSQASECTVLRVRVVICCKPMRSAD